ARAGGARVAAQTLARDAPHSRHVERPARRRERRGGVARAQRSGLSRSGSRLSPPQQCRGALLRTGHGAYAPQSAALGRRTGTPRATCLRRTTGRSGFCPPPAQRGCGGTNDMREGATMARKTGWSLVAAAAATLVVAGACNDDSQSPKPRALLGLPDVGTLAVTVTTSGSNTPGGYTIVVDGSSSQSVGANAVATFLGLPPGSHTVFLSGVPSNCSVSGANPRSVSLIAGVVAATTFSVGCSALPTTGSLTVTTATSGASGDVDPDGYTVSVDGSSSRSIGANGSVTFSGLSAGSHSVA